MIWLTRNMVEAFHRESLVRFGGADGLRDEGLLLSALARQVLQQVRDLGDSLRPVVLDELGLEPALDLHRTGRSIARLTLDELL